MVTITNCFLRNEGTCNEHVELELTGPLEYFQKTVDKKERLYATAGTVLIPSTLAFRTARNLIGTQMRGAIRRKDSPRAEVKLPDSKGAKKLIYTPFFINIR